MPREVYSPEQLQALHKAVHILAEDAGEPARERLQALARRALSLADAGEVDAEKLVALLRAETHAAPISSAQGN